MQAWEEKILDKQKAYEEGCAETLAHVHMELLELVRKKLDKGYSPEEIADFLEEDIDVIQDLIKEIHASS